MVDLKLKGFYTVIISVHAASNDERLIDICDQHSLQIKYGFRMHKDIYKYLGSGNPLTKICD